MLSKLLVCITLCFAGLQGASWTPAATIPAVPSSGIVGANLFGVYNSATNQVFAAWQDGQTTNFASYAIYSPVGGWSQVFPMNTTVFAVDDIFLAYDSANQTIFATLGDKNNSKYPTALIYQNGTWGLPQVIDTTTTVVDNVFTVYNPVTNQMFAGWQDGGVSRAPIISIFSGGTWGPIATLSSQVASDVTFACDTTTGTVYAAWVESSTHIPTYAVYPVGGPWSSPATISSTTALNVANVFLTYDPQTRQVVATWNHANRPYYSLFNGTSWSPALAISNSVVSQAGDIITAYNSDTGQIFAAWETSKNPYYAILDPVTQMWGSAAAISLTSTVVQDVSLVYAPGLTTMFALWQLNAIPFYPFWSGYFFLPSPANFTGRKNINDFGTESETFAQLRWTLVPGATGYRISLDNIPIAVVNGTTSAYDAHDLPRGVSNFTLVAFNAGGESAPVSLTLK